MNELEILRRIQALEREIERMKSHSHGQYETGIKTARIIEAAPGYQGFAILVAANEDIKQGQVVCWLQGASGADNKVNLVPTTGNSLDMPIGVAVADINANATGWIIVAGYAMALPMTSVDPVRGYVIYCSATEAGYLDQAASGATAQHWREVGHWCADGTGNGALTLATLHFN